jgi:hypothetical protein
MSSSIQGVKTTLVDNVIGSVVFTVLVGLVFLFFQSTGLQPFFAEEYEDAEAAVSYLARHALPNDVLYVHASMGEQFKLYTPARQVIGGKIVYGKTGAPCCPRKDYRNPQQESADDVIGEISALGNAAAGQSLWLLVTDRPLHWFYLQRNDIEILERDLANKGCTKIEEAKFTGVYIGHFGCKPK